MIFRISYFQELFPLPFLVKIIHRSTFLTISASIVALEYIIPFIIIILISLFIINRRTESYAIIEKHKFDYFLFTFLIAFIFANIVYIFNQPSNNYSQRFFYPSFVLIYVAFGIAISILFNGIGTKYHNAKLLKNTVIITIS